MKCPVCNETELQGKQKYCSGACKTKASRNRNSGDNNVTLVTANVTVTDESVPNVTKGHWIGKAPHKPIWSECLREDCPQMHNPEPNWEPSCEKACCA